MLCNILWPRQFYDEPVLCVDLLMTVSAGQEVCAKKGKRNKIETGQKIEIPTDLLLFKYLLFQFTSHRSSAGFLWLLVYRLAILLHRSDRKSINLSLDTTEINYKRPFRKTENKYNYYLLALPIAWKQWEERESLRGELGNCYLLIFPSTFSLFALLKNNVCKKKVMQSVCDAWNSHINHRHDTIAISI